MECRGRIEHKPCDEEKTWTTVPSTMSGGFQWRQFAQRVTDCVTTGQAEPRMHDERLFERRPLVLSPEEKPEVYRYRSCVGWCMLRLNTSCKSLFQVYVNGQKGMRHRQPKMPSRDRSDLRCADNTLTRTDSAPGQHTMFAQCEERF